MFSFPCNSVRFIDDCTLVGRILNPIKRSSEVTRLLTMSCRKDEVLSSIGRKFRLLLTKEMDGTWTMLIPPFEVGGDPWTAIYRNIPHDILAPEPTYPALCPPEALQWGPQAMDASQPRST